MSGRGSTGDIAIDYLDLYGVVLMGVCGYTLLLILTGYGS